MKNTYLKAKAYIEEKGTALQRACMAWIDGQGSKQAILEALKAYQNEDGGFANGMEIEYQGPVSSTMATIAALDHIVRFDLKESEIFTKVIRYFNSIQGSDGCLDENEDIDAYPHPPYMQKGVYREYNTGMVLRWLLAIGAKEEPLMTKALDYMTSHFEEDSKKQDIWTAIGYLGVFSQLPPSEDNQKIVDWCLGVFMGGGQEVPTLWQQHSSRIESGLPIPPQEVEAVLEEIKNNQDEDGGWAQPFGEYSRVWQAIYILQFIKNNLRSL